MRSLPATLLLLIALKAQAVTVAQPYTFDYFVHVESGPKPMLVFGTGKTTYLQVTDDVVINKVVVRKGKSEKETKIYYSDPYVVVKEFHDSLKVYTNKGVFVAERGGEKTEVEVAAENADLAKKESDEAKEKLKQQDAEIAKLRDELTTNNKQLIAQAPSAGVRGGAGTQNTGAGDMSMPPQNGNQEFVIDAGDLVHERLGAWLERNGYSLYWETVKLRAGGRLVLNKPFEESLREIVAMIQANGLKIEVALFENRVVRVSEVK